MSTFLCRWQPPSGWKAAKRSSGNCWIGESYIWCARMPHRHAAIAARRQGSNMTTHCRQQRTSPTAQIPEQNQGCRGGFCANLETAYEICGLVQPLRCAHEDHRAIVIQAYSVRVQTPNMVTFTKVKLSR